MKATRNDHNDELAQRFFENGVHATGATTIMRSPQDLYNVWRRLEELPRFIDHLVEVRPTSATRSLWTTKGPGDRQYSWEAEIIHDEPGRRISWKTVGEAEVPNAGTIMFRELPHWRGTVVRVSLEYLPPGGKAGLAIAKSLGDDARGQVHEALHRFRQLMECGEIARSKPVSAGKGRARHDRPGEEDMPEYDTDFRDLAETKAQAPRDDSPTTPSRSGVGSPPTEKPQKGAATTAPPTAARPPAAAGRSAGTQSPSNPSSTDTRTPGKKPRRGEIA